VNPFASKGGLGGGLGQKKKAATSGAAALRDEIKKKQYTIEYLLSFRPQFRARPPNMALLDFPHKKKRNLRQNEMSETDKFNLTVRELRILLNKLSKDNFENVARKITHDYSFSPSLLNELMKILFMKATTEATYLELYVRLCILLFKKYNDKENKEMNFKKLLLMKCQKQFYKSHEKHQEEVKQRSRKTSANLDSGEKPEEE
jgi:hypothetical protein